MELLNRLLTFSLLQAFFPGSLSQSWSVSMPMSIQALKGYCVVIPCTFSHPQPRNASEGFHVIWYLKGLNNYSEVFNSRVPRTGGSMFQGRTFLVGDTKKKNCSLQINSVRTEDTAVYYISIDSQSNSYSSQNVSVQLRISGSPGNVSLSNPGSMSEGKPVKIICSVEHTCPSNPPKLSWSMTKSTVNLLQKELSEGRWRSVTTLTYQPFFRDHKKFLQCKATYPNGQISEKSITLNINYAPKETTASVIENLELREGGSVTLKCSNNANPTVTYYRWFQGQQKMVLQYKTQQITIQNLTWDSGPYSCKAKNTEGDGYSPLLTLKILYSPKDTRISVVGNSIIQEGDYVQLICSSHSNPEVTNYSWYQGTQDILQHHGQQITLQNLTWNSGPYYCTAHNALGMSISPPLHLNVSYAPKGIHLFAPGKEQIYERDPLMLRCESSSSNPAVSYYTWYKDGILLVNTSQNILEIQSVRPQDAGAYHCTAHNEIGTASSTRAIINIIYFQWKLNLPIVLGAAVGSLFLLLLTLTILIYVRNKKTQSEATPDKVTYTKSLDESSVLDKQPNDYMDSTYTALDLTTRSSEYEELKVNSISTPTLPKKTETD
uniref:Carcinoembryonic antigen-related cell adhesion molecule 1-like n=1 Tax=Geotrypetes seraphini TaxID=260995 RepID=A0A6P8SJ42_GEOSA|nr:carcinoembryonic antigen-related cell adhesion molecule 1-like [Geotrypetes seraphini]